MRSRLIPFRMQNSDPSMHSPEEKLRKISFDVSEIEQFPLFDDKKQQEMNVVGWGNQNWDFKTEELIIRPKSRKTLSRTGKEKSVTSGRKFPLVRDNLMGDRSKYIEKLEEKLNLLEERKSQRVREVEKKKNDSQIQKLTTQKAFFSPFTPQYLTPVKHQRITQQTTSTSESDCDNKCEHNFTSTMYRKLTKDKQLSFNPGRKSKQIELKQQRETKKSAYEYTAKRLLLEQSQMDGNEKYRSVRNRSMLDSYEGWGKRSKEVSLISYPVIDSQRLTKKGTRTSKLNDFFERFSARNNSEVKQSSRSVKKKLIFNERQQSVLIKVTGPKEVRNEEK